MLSTLVTVLVVQPPTRATEVTIVGDDEADAYRGTGGLLLGSSFSGTKSQRWQVAQCMSCVWRYVNYCRTGSESDATCTHSVVTCPRGKLRYRIMFASDGKSFRTIGSICQGAKAPTTRRDVERVLSSSSLHRLPALLPKARPLTTLTIVPVAFSASQPSNFVARAKYVGDARVILHAHATWRWDWGDGHKTTTSLTSSMPDTSRKKLLEHQYRSAGTYLVRVQTRWKGQYEVVGLGTFPVPGLITQDARISVQVRRAHSVLLGSAVVR